VCLEDSSHSPTRLPASPTCRPQELSALEAEASVLARTLTVLGAPEEAPPASKDSSLLSSTVTATGSAADLNALRDAIAARKAELAPKVQQLRAAREAFQVQCSLEVLDVQVHCCCSQVDLNQQHHLTPTNAPQALEARLSAAREAREAAVGPLERRCAALELEVASLKREADEGRAALGAAEAAVASLEESARLAAEGGGPDKLRERCVVVLLLVAAGCGRWGGRGVCSEGGLPSLGKPTHHTPLRQHTHTPHTGASSAWLKQRLSCAS